MKLGFLLLCGGQSRRMGTSKALLEVGGRTLLETVADAGASFEERILSVNDESIPTPKGFIRCADVYPGCGPMAGLHAALSMSSCDALVVAPCDAPHYSRALAQHLRDQFAPELDALIVTDENGRVHPLCGVYSRRCLPALEAHLKTGRLKLMGMLDALNTRRIPLPEHIGAHALQNVNTPQDLAALSAEQSAHDPR